MHLQTTHFGDSAFNTFLNCFWQRASPGTGEPCTKLGNRYKNFLSHFPSFSKRSHMTEKTETQPLPGNGVVNGDSHGVGRTAPLRGL